MAGFNGKWRLVSSENGEAFFNANNASEEYKTALRSLWAEHKTNPDIYQEELKVDKAAGTIQRIVYLKGAVQKDSGPVQFNQERDGKAHGNPAKITVTLDSDTKITRKEVGSNFNSTAVVEVSGDELTLTMTGNGVTAKEKYARV